MNKFIITFVGNKKNIRIFAFCTMEYKWTVNTSHSAECEEILNKKVYF